MSDDKMRKTGIIQLLILLLVVFIVIYFIARLVTKDNDLNNNYNAKTSDVTHDEQGESQDEISDNTNDDNSHTSSLDVSVVATGYLMYIDSEIHLVDSSIVESELDETPFDIIIVTEDDVDLDKYFDEQQVEVQLGDYFIIKDDISGHFTLKAILLSIELQ